jgi:hypothetical protein
VIGNWETSVSSLHRADINQARWLFHVLGVRSKLSSWPGLPHKIVHRKRSHNSLADAAANLAHKIGKYHRVCRFGLESGDKILVTSDGSFCRFTLRASIACVVFVYRANCAVMILSCIGYDVKATSSVDSEFQALHLGIHAVMDWLSYHCANISQYKKFQCSLWP